MASLRTFYPRQIRDPHFVMWVLKTSCLQNTKPFIHTSKQVFLFIIDCIQSRRHPLPFKHKQLAGKLISRDTYAPINATLIHTQEVRMSFCWAEPKTMNHVYDAGRKFEILYTKPRFRDANILQVGSTQNIIVVGKGPLLGIYDYKKGIWAHDALVPTRAQMLAPHQLTLAIHPSQEMIAVGGSDEVTRIYEQIGGRWPGWAITHIFTAQEHCINHVAFHETLGYFVSAARDNNVVVYTFDNPGGWSVLYSVRYPDEIKDVVFHPTLPVLVVDIACRSKGGGVHILDLRDTESDRLSDLPHSESPRTCYCRAAHFHPRLPWFAVAMLNGGVEIYDCKRPPWRRLCTIIPPNPYKIKQWQGSIAFHPTHPVLAMLWGASVSFLAPGSSLKDWRCLGRIEKIPTCVMFCNRHNSSVCFHRTLPLLFIAHRREEPTPESQSILEEDITIVYNVDHLDIFR